MKAVPSHLMDDVFQNDLILENIFTSLNLPSLRSIRLVCIKWNQLSGRMFADKSLVRLRLVQNTYSSSDMIYTNLEVNGTSNFTIHSGKCIKSVIGTQLDSFKNFAILFNTYQHSEQAYADMLQLVRHLWSPTGSISHMETFDDPRIPKRLLFSLVEAFNSFRKVEMTLNFRTGYENGLQFNCDTLNVVQPCPYSSLKDGVMSHFFNLKRIIFNHCYNLKDFFAYMETNLNKFDKLVEIEIFDCIGNLYDLKPLSRLERGLKTLKIQLYSDHDTRVEFDDFIVLEMILVRHSSTLKELSLAVLSLQREKITPIPKFASIKFPKLQKLALDMTAFEHCTSGCTDKMDSRDIFNIGVAVEGGNFLNRFPLLTHLEISLAHSTFQSILSRITVEELEGKYNVYVRQDKVVKNWYE
ncbi:uncharacterized protein LOC110863424 isoform X2 [Folsomia candida]|nr:uncharacterized protein LOC110863424 isoform X2 [Folsomia candida]XP_021968424.1 uncharacterized protein LOC110863424 isoform X2 [Folsomia candida]XP_035702349.1 uncharacterized protein LOC110863424 isoform X2 [Folsomia candida]